MGHIQKMTNEQRSKWISYQYNAKKEANKGYNFEYFNQDKWDILEIKGYQMHKFKDAFGYQCYSTISVMEAKNVVDELRKNKNYARIICGYDKDVQNTKYYTVIFKSKLPSPYLIDIIDLSNGVNILNNPKHGGTRKGSGAKPKYNEETKTIAFRCPISKVDELKTIINAKLNEWMR